MQKCKELKDGLILLKITISAQFIGNEVNATDLRSFNSTSLPFVGTGIIYDCFQFGITVNVKNKIGKNRRKQLGAHLYNVWIDTVRTTGFPRMNTFKSIPCFWFVHDR